MWALYVTAMVFILLAEDASASKASVELVAKVRVGEGTVGAFDGPHTVFYANGRTVTRWDWKTGKRVCRKLGMPCARQSMQIVKLEPVPNQASVVMRFCDRLVAISKRTLEFQQYITPEGMSFLGFRLSSEGNRMAAVKRGGPGLDDVWIFETDTWQRVRRITGDLDSFDLSSDGTRLLIWTREVDQEKFVRSCAVAVVDVDSGTPLSQFSHRDLCFMDPHFYPLDETLIFHSGKGYRLLDWRTGAVRRQWRSECSATVFQERWEWLAATNVDDPDDTDAIQQLKICDAHSGEQLYASKTIRWNLFDHLAFAFASGGRWAGLIDVRPLDAAGDYLLFRRHKQLEVLKITKH
jgi:hypothetical protein